MCDDRLYRSSEVLKALIFKMHPTQERSPTSLQRFFSDGIFKFWLWGGVIPPTMSQRHYAVSRESYQQDMIAASVIDPQGDYDRCQLAKLNGSFWPPAMQQKYFLVWAKPAGM